MACFALFAVLFFQNIVNTQGYADYLNTEIFQRVKQPQFVLFYAPWCSHCKQLLPTWNQLADKSHENNWNNIKISKVNCVEETAFCSKQNIVAYPTMKLFHDGDMSRFDGRQSLSELQGFIKQALHKVHVDEEEGLMTLTSENFDAHIKQGNGLHFVDFYVPWCIHCQRFEPTWKAIAKHYEDNPDITIAKVDCTVETIKCKKWGVNSFPTLMMFKNGNQVDQYTQSRDIETVKKYINDMLYQHSMEIDKKSFTETEPSINPDESTNIESDSSMEFDDDTMNVNPVVEIYDRTFDMLIEQEPAVFVNFYIPWSEKSQELAETWRKLGSLCQKEGLTIIAQIDCSRFSDVCKKYKITQYPTLILFKQGERFYYNQQRTLNSLHKFVKQHFHDEL